MADASHADVSDDDLSQKHKKERKELQAKIMTLKHGISKGDKKKKKEVLEQIAKLEADLNMKHDLELASRSQEFSNSEETNEINAKFANLTTTAETENDVQRGKISKAQKRRDKKEQKDRERQQRIAEQEQENLTGARNIEAEKIKTILSEKGLALYEIKSDGDCLYAALVHQLAAQGKVESVANLRKQTASFIRENPDEFLPFMCGQDGEMLTQEKFIQYCDETETTPAWGGQLELRALAETIKQPIEVIQADMPSIMTGNYDGPPLIITYHRHVYGLGEHYNTVVPKTEIEDDDGFT